MIGSLRGVLAEREPAGEQAVACLVEVQGVGYRVIVGARLAAELGPVGGEVALSVHTYVREGAITLYGFGDVAERRAFELLLAAHGVGPALAVAILGTHSPGGLARAVAGGDLEALCLVPGVGRKTAQRLLVELAQRLDTLVPLPVPAGSGAGAPGARAEVGEALAALGYGPEEVRVVLEGLAEGTGSVEELLRAALAELAPR